MLLAFLTGPHCLVTLQKKWQCNLTTAMACWMPVVPRLFFVRKRILVEQQILVPFLSIYYFTAHLICFLKQIWFMWLLSKAKSCQVTSFCFNKALILWVEIHIWKDNILLQLNCVMLWSALCWSEMWCWGPTFLSEFLLWFQFTDLEKALKAGDSLSDWLVWYKYSVFDINILYNFIPNVLPMFLPRWWLDINDRSNSMWDQELTCKERGS